MAPILIHKVFAYITHGHCLLVFRHADFPEAGIQVPAGTIQPDEHPDEAVLREVYEETGLSDFTEVYLLGELIRDMADFHRDEVHQRYFYGETEEQCVAREVLEATHFRFEVIRFLFEAPDIPEGSYNHLRTYLRMILLFISCPSQILTPAQS